MSAPCQHDWTPLQSASLAGHALVVRILLARGAKPDLARLDVRPSLPYRPSNCSFSQLSP